MKTFYTGIASAASIAVIASSSAVSIASTVPHTQVAIAEHNRPRVQAADDGHMHPKGQMQVAIAEHNRPRVQVADDGHMHPKGQMQVADDDGHMHPKGQAC